MPVYNPGAKAARGVAAASQSRSSGPLGWFFHLSMAGRAFVIFAALLVAIALVFAEENWRGRAAWESCRHGLEAKGVQIDWHRFVPRPVPDEQNFAMTPFLAPLFDFNPKPLQPGQTAWRDTAGHDRAMKFTVELTPADKPGKVTRMEFDGRFIDLEAATGSAVVPAAIDGAFVVGFEDAFGARLLPGTLTESEALRAAELRCWKYDSIAWTRGGAIGSREARWGPAVSR